MKKWHLCVRLEFINTNSKYKAMRNFIAIILCCFLVSCNNEKTLSGEDIYVEKNIKLTLLIEDIFEIDRCVLLESNDNGLIGGVNKIVQHNADFFLSDGAAIYNYDREGRYKNVFDRRGRGPEEYLSIRDFVINNNIITLTDAVGDEIFQYTIDGNFIRRRKIDKTPSSMAILNDEIIALKHTSFLPGKKISLLDFDTLEECGHFGIITQNESKYMHFMGVNSFSYNQGSLLYNDIMDNQIYEVGVDSVRVRYKVDLYGNNPPDSFYENDYQDVQMFMESFDKQGYQSGMYRFVEGDNSLFFVIRGKDGIKISLYNKETNNSVQAYSVKLAEGIPDIDAYDFRIYPQINEEVLFLIDPVILFDENKELISDKFGVVKEDSNPIVCILKLR